MNMSAPGYPEQPIFFESAKKGIFGLLGVPSSASNLREGVILCAPAPHEVKKYYWTMRQMAQRLQLAGYHTLRFDYFATGDSEGDGRDFDLDICRMNIQDAVQYLKGSGLIRRVSLVATRLACPLALQATQEERVRKLILIDPVWDGPAYLDQAKDMHRKMVKEHFITAPCYQQAALQGQLLGFPHNALLSWQMEHIDAFPRKIKAKSASVISTLGSPDPGPLVSYLSQQIEETRHLKISDKLKWGDARALQFQDFPNKLIRSVVDSIRGAS